MRIIKQTLLLVLALVRSSAAAQFARAVIGGAVGVAGGAMITMSVVVARARFQGEYLESIEDLIHWQSTAMILAPAVGIMFGLAGRDPLVGSIIGSTTGLALGAAVGALLGWLLFEQPEWPWAGGVMGAGAGMTVGGLVLGIRAWARSNGGDGAGQVPVGMRGPM